MKKLSKLLPILLLCALIVPCTLLVIPSDGAIEGRSGVLALRNTSGYMVVDSVYRTIIDPTKAIFATSDFAPTPIPEPATILMMGTGLIGIATFARKKLANK